MEENTRNFILAIVLSMAILGLWQFFYGIPKMEEERARKQQEIAQQQKTQAEKAEEKKAEGSVPTAETKNIPQPQADKIDSQYPAGWGCFQWRCERASSCHHP